MDYLQVCFVLLIIVYILTFVKIPRKTFGFLPADTKLDIYKCKQIRQQLKETKEIV